MFRASPRLLVAIYSPAFVLLTVLVGISFFYAIPIEAFTRDAAAIKKFHPFVGILSNLGILVWCAAASICFFTAFVLWQTHPRQPAQFLFASGLLTLALLLDDLFLFHELLAQQFFSLSERSIYLVYGLVTLTYLYLFRRLILQTALTILGLAFFFFAVSIVIDEILFHWLQPLRAWVYLFEDGTKFLGLISWCGYFAHYAYHTLYATPHTNHSPNSRTDVTET